MPCTTLPVPASAVPGIWARDLPDAVLFDIVPYFYFFVARHMDLVDY